jgi:acetyl-CoA C-acetyltransferase
VLALEALRFYDPGGAISAATRWETTVNDALPITLSDGHKAKGQLVGAIDPAQIWELTKLLRGDCLNSDAVADVEVGVIRNAEGTVACAVVHVLMRSQTPRVL